VDDKQVTNRANIFSRLRYCALPYLVIISFPLAIVVSNPVDTPVLSDLAHTIGFLLACVAILHIPFGLLVRRSQMRELLFSALIVYVMAYGYILEGVPANVLRQRYVFLLWNALFVLLVVLMWKYSGRKVFVRIVSAFQTVVISLLCVQGVWFGLTIVSDLRAGDVQRRVIIGEPLRAASAACDLPDIYYIILDAYGRSDVLRESYSCDNRDFLKELERRGFFIVSKSRVNYPQTSLSLASSLNMDYLNDWGLSAFTTRQPLLDAIDNNELGRALKEYGYTTVCFEKCFRCTPGHSFDQSALAFRTLSELQDALYRTTIVWHVRKRFGVAFASKKWRRIALRTFEGIPEVTKNTESPSFVFAHIYPPHPPFMFDADGNALDPVPWAGNQEVVIQRYCELAMFVNRKVIELVDKILAKSSRPAVIVLQGDHGPNPEWGLGEENVSRSLYARERFPILNAIYVPSDQNVRFYESMTPVNTFRLILDHYFKTGLGRLEDRCYYSHYDDPYDFLDVTTMTLGSVGDR